MLADNWILRLKKLLKLIKLKKKKLKGTWAPAGIFVLWIKKKTKIFHLIWITKLRKYRLIMKIKNLNYTMFYQFTVNCYSKFLKHSQIPKNCFYTCNFEITYFFLKSITYTFYKLKSGHRWHTFVFEGFAYFKQ